MAQQALHPAGIVLDEQGTTEGLLPSLAFGAIVEETQAAVGGITAEATAGALTLTGAAADVEIGTSISLEASPGTLSLTGQAADQVITETGSVAYEGTPGTLTLTGQAADQAITTNLDLQATAGALTLTGLAADVQTGVFINADATPGTIALTGQAATVDVTTNLSLEANPGSIVLSGVQADVTGLAVAVTAPAAPSGVRAPRKAQKYRYIKLGDRRYRVESKAQERELLAQYLASLEKEKEQAQALQQPVRVKQAEKRIRLTVKRIQKAEEPDFRKIELKALDDEIVAILGAYPWL